MAIILAEHANEPVDVARVVKMLLIHDIVEIDAGDTYAFDLVGTLDKEEREQLAAARLFGLLPPDQAAELQRLWEEFEARETAEARFATAIDRLEPVLLNYQSGGLSWQENGIQAEQVRTLMQRLQPGSTTLWHYADSLITEAATRGYFDPMPMN
jgi:putative hydrolase of HD superfamily